MNPDQPSREPIEARITALLCGELPADEAELLRWTISQDPELQKLHDQLKLTIGFVREALKNPTGAQMEKETAIKLSQEKRQALLAHFKTERPQRLNWLKRIEVSSPYSSTIAVIVILMICGLVVISIPNLVRSRATSQSNSIINNLRQIDSAKQEWALENHKSPKDVPTSNDLTPYVQAMGPVAGEKYTLGKVSEPAVAEFHGERLTAMQSHAAPAVPRALMQANIQLRAPTPATPPPQMAQIVLPNTETQKESDLNGNAIYLKNPARNAKPVRIVNISPGANGPSPTPTVQPPPAVATTESPASESEPDTNVFSQKVVGYVNISMPTNAPVVEAPSATAMAALPVEASPSSPAPMPSVAESAPPNPGVSALTPPAGGYNFQSSPASKEPFGNRLQSTVRGNDFSEGGGGGDAVAFQATNGPLALSWPANQAGQQLRSIQPNAVPDAGTVSFGSGPAPKNNFISRNQYLAPNFDTNAVALNFRLDKNSSDRGVGEQSEHSPSITREMPNAPSVTESTSSFSRLPADAIPIPAQPPMGTQAGTVGTSNPSTGVPMLGSVPVTGRLFAGSASAQSQSLGQAEVAQGGTAATTFSPQQSQEFYNGQAGIGPSQAYLESKHQFYDKIELGTPPTAAQSDRPLIQSPAIAPIPQPEVQTRDNAFSTFSLNVSDVSFKLALASLEKGLMPRPASIRTEEFINAFDYHDPEPLQGQPLAFKFELARNPFEHERDFLRFSVKAGAAGRDAGRPLNLVLLLDTSGSMERADRVAIIREALRVLAAQLQPQDTVSVVTFARTARLWADGVRGDRAGATLDKVGSITPEGGTNLEEAMRLAYETALRHFLAHGMNRVVLLTDGAANLGNVDPQVLTQKVEAERRQGIALDCFGIGWEDYNDDLLEQLSSNGDGRYAFLNSPDEAATEFAAKLAGALQVAAEDVKVQVEFNPNRVTSWRQIGYAKHQLTKEQFRDNSVAAGAIAAREAGNALYVIETNPDGQGPIATVRVRYRVPGTQENYERSWLVDYTGSAPELAQSSPAMRLAVSAAEFSEWLAGSPFAQEVTPDELLKYLSGVPQLFSADDRPKQLQSMILQAKSVSGK